MGLHLLILMLGLGLLLLGGEMIVRGASTMARTLGISPLIIGLTIVAFGTSTPEMAINLTAAFQGSPDLSFGNIIGSNIANIGLVIGISALIQPLVIHNTIIVREIPMMILASGLALITGLDLWMRQSPNLFDRTDGLIFLMVFCVFMFYTIGDAIQEREAACREQSCPEDRPRKVFAGIPASLFLFFAGLALLILGSRISVDSAVMVAEILNVPRAIIGLTIIAVGTSLPELATSVMAAVRGQTDMAVGNIVGSNIFNLLFVNGICSTLTPIPVPAGGENDLFMMAFLALIMLPLCITHDKQILRKEGALLLVLYFSFNIWRVATGQ